MENNKPRVFISYSQKNMKLMNEIKNALNEQGNIAYADIDILKPGDKWSARLNAEIYNSDGALVIFTENYEHSPTASAELKKLLNLRNKGNLKFIIPVIYASERIPRILQDIQCIFMNDDNFLSVIEQINNSINRIMLEYANAPGITEVEKPVSHDSLDFPLEIGSRGEKVANLQSALKYLGFFASVSDGILGKSTLTAYNNYQKEFRKEITNFIDQKSFEELGNRANKTGIERVRGPRIIRKKPTSEKKVLSIHPNYWILKLNNNWFRFRDELGPNVVKNFHTYRDGAKRPDYDSFLSIKNGDILLGFYYKNSRNISCKFIAEKILNVGDPKKERLKFRVEELFSPEIHFNNFHKKVNFKEDLTLQNDNRLFSITEDDYKIIINSIGPVPKKEIHSFYPWFNSEGKHTLTKDQLDFTMDILSFAMLISLKQEITPLAIGLFGKWGSGKSYFMDNLEVQIDAFCKPDENGFKNEKFIDNVVHIKFNSWHYSDTNLWASLITVIFSKLAKYADDKGMLNQFEELSLNMKIASFQSDTIQNLTNTLELTEAQKGIKILEKQNLETEIDKIKSINKEIRDNLDDLSKKEIFLTLIEDKYISKDIYKLFNSNLENTMVDISKINSSLVQIQNSWLKVKYFFSNFFTSKGKWRFAFFIPAIIFLAVGIILTFYLKEFKEFTLSISAIISAVSAFTAKSMKDIQPIITGINEAADRMKSIKDALEKRPVAANKELEVKGKKLEQVNVSIVELKNKISNTKKELDELKSGKKLLNFIKEKANDEIYSKQLGLISWVREDFEKLNNILLSQKELNKNKNGNENENEEKNIPETKEVLKIDRIILYIDDLDRCNEEIVVKVLEAIHLLLAFPLFVVIVGVDPRWLNNSINSRLKNSFGYDAAGIQTIIPGAATSYDYLEKIFQIPFALKPINNSGRESLISYLIRNEMEEEKIIADTEPAGKENPEAEGNGEIKGNQATEGSEINNVKNDIKKKINSEPGTVKNTDPVSISDQDIKQMIKNISFTKKELEFMKRVSPIFGTTPRTINRFVNIYRIIKSHGTFVVTEEFSENEFIPAMILLSIVVGCDKADEFIEDLLSSDGKEDFKIFLERSRLERSFKNIISQSINGNTEFTTNNFTKYIDLISRFSFRTIIYNTL